MFLLVGIKYIHVLIAHNNSIFVSGTCVLRVYLFDHRLFSQAVSNGQMAVDTDDIQLKNDLERFSYTYSNFYVTTVLTEISST